MIHMGYTHRNARAWSTRDADSPPCRGLTGTEPHTPTDADVILCFVNRLQPLVLEWRWLTEDQQSKRLTEAVAELPEPDSLPAQIILSGIVSLVVSGLRQTSLPEPIGHPRRLAEYLLACLPLKGPDECPQVRLAIRHMQSSLSDSSLNTRTMARRVGCSPSHFGRLFKKVTGSAFAHVLRRHRTIVAFELLREGRLSVKEIAAAVGYKHVTDFDRHFKLETGVCPSMARRGGDHHVRTLSVLREAIVYAPDPSVTRNG